MDTVTELPQAQLQAKIDQPLHDELNRLATEKTLAMRKRIFPRDLVNDALKDYLPRVRKALDKQQKRS